MTVYVLFCSGDVVKASTSLNELKKYVLEKGVPWNYNKHWHRVAYEILEVYVPTGDEVEEDG
jgi:hypothetical protein